MDMQCATVIEDEQLMLRPLLDANDAMTAQGGEGARADEATKRRVEEPDAVDGPAHDGATDAASGALDFGELRHREPANGISAGD